MKNHLITFLVVFAACLAALYAFTEYQARKYRAVAHLIEGLTLASGFKGPVTVFFQDEGRFPASNGEAGLLPAAAYTAGAVASVSIGPGGIITGTYTEKSGVAGGTVRWTPSAPHGVNGPMSWQCTSPSYPNIATALASCRFVPD